MICFAVGFGGAAGGNCSVVGVEVPPLPPFLPLPVSFDGPEAVGGAGGSAFAFPFFAITLCVVKRNACFEPRGCRAFETQNYHSTELKMIVHQ